MIILRLSSPELYKHCFPRRFFSLFQLSTWCAIFLKPPLHFFPFLCVSSCSYNSEHLMMLCIIYDRLVSTWLWSREGWFKGGGTGHITKSRCAFSSEFLCVQERSFFWSGAIGCSWRVGGFLLFPLPELPASLVTTKKDGTGVAFLEIAISFDFHLHFSYCLHLSPESVSFPSLKGPGLCYFIRKAGLCSAGLPAY